MDEEKNTFILKSSFTCGNSALEQFNQTMLAFNLFMRMCKIEYMITIRHYLVVPPFIYLNTLYATD